MPGVEPPKTVKSVMYCAKKSANVASGHRDVEPIEREMSAERAEQRQDSAESEEQQRQIQEAARRRSGKERHGIELVLAGFAGAGRGVELAQEARRDGDFEALEPRLRLGLRPFLPRRGAQGVGR